MVIRFCLTFDTIHGIMQTCQYTADISDAPCKGPGTKAQQEPAKRDQVNLGVPCCHKQPGTPFHWRR